MSHSNAPKTESWDTLADYYEKATQRAQYFVSDWIPKHVHEISGQPECRVLDLGCGTGINGKLLCELRSGIRVDGVDISPRMLEHASATGKYEKLRAQDLDNALLDTPSDTFDLVIAFGFLEFLSDVYVCLAECHRALKTDGLLWATFRRFEAGDVWSPPRTVAFEDRKNHGYSASEILYMMNSLDMRVTDLDSIAGHLTENGFVVPYYVLQARKIQ